MQHREIIKKYRANVSGRYITNDHIVSLLPADTLIAGWSVADREIYVVEAGHGPQKILLWSQMHGNESTTTKALLDMLEFLKSGSEEAAFLLSNFTLKVVPILNPDGAVEYTRENANGIDLNRDFKNLSQPESNLLMQVFNDFQPDFCFNMHDQRTIYGAGNSGKPATVSFLAPAYNADRDWNQSRGMAAAVISAMNQTLQEVIPGQVGRYDDSYNINCAGDSFQNLGVPTILFEAGHFQNDYQRDQTRSLIFLALLSGFDFLARLQPNHSQIQDYLNIPQNEVNFFDIVYKNVKIDYAGKEIITNFAAQFREQLANGKTIFEAGIVEAVGDNVFGHVQYDCRNELFSSGFGSHPIEGMPADFFIGKRQFQNGCEVEILNA